MEIIFKQAIDAHREGKLKEAEKLYRKVLKNQPTNLTALNNLGVLLSNFGIFGEAEIHYRKAIELNPNYTDAYINLANILKNIGRIDEAEAAYKKALELNPSHAKTYNNLGTLLLDLGKFDEAEVSYRKAIEFKNDYAEAYNGLGSVLKDLGKLNEAEVNYRKAINLKPNYIEAHYNLGIILFSLKNYKEAAEKFKLINIKNSKELFLKCLLKLDEKSNFYNQLDSLINQGVTNSIIGSLTSLAEIKYGINKENSFCNNPLNYVLKTDLAKQCNFKNTFIKIAENFLTDHTVQKKFQTLLTNGVQTSGNIFNQGAKDMDLIKEIIYSEIEKYRAHFKDKEEGFLKNWPTNYFINGWLISMKSGGSLSPHMHELSWISGSIYINVPPKSKADSGNLVVCIGDKINETTSEKKIVDVVTGSMCLFPSSLYHYTIPFEADEDRIVLAFDILQK